MTTTNQTEARTHALNEQEERDAGLSPAMGQRDDVDGEWFARQPKAGAALATSPASPPPGRRSPKNPRPVQRAV